MAIVFKGTMKSSLDVGSSKKHSTKSHKKVSFDVAPRAINFARKSTAPHHYLQSPGHAPCRCKGFGKKYMHLELKKGFGKKCMHLELKKVDTTGYKIPQQSMSDYEYACLYGCARLLPVDEALSSARTSKVRNKHEKKSFGSEISRILRSRNTSLMDKRVYKKVDVAVLKSVLKNKLAHRLISKSAYKKSKKTKLALQKLETSNVVVKNKNESRKRAREPEEKQVNFSVDEPTMMEPTSSSVLHSTSSPQALPSASVDEPMVDNVIGPFTSSVRSPQASLSASVNSPPSMASAEAEYQQRLKETIDKMSEEPAQKRKK